MSVDSQGPEVTANITPRDYPHSVYHFNHTHSSNIPDCHASATLTLLTDIEPRIQFKLMGTIQLDAEIWPPFTSLHNPEMWPHFEGNAQEFDVVVEGATPAERLAKQRRSLRKRLGMGGKMDELIDTSDLIEDDDLLVSEPVLAAGSTQKAASTEATELLSNMEGAQISCYLILQ